jgi:hypothetical protein
MPQACRRTTDAYLVPGKVLTGVQNDCYIYIGSFVSGCQLAAALAIAYGAGNRRRLTYQQGLPIRVLCIGRVRILRKNGELK